MDYRSNANNFRGVVSLVADEIALIQDDGRPRDIHDIFLETDKDVATVHPVEQDVGGGIKHTTLEWDSISDRRVPGLDSLIRWLRQNPYGTNKHYYAISHTNNIFEQYQLCHTTRKVCKRYFNLTNNLDVSVLRKKTVVIKKPYVPSVDIPLGTRGPRGRVGQGGVPRVSSKLTPCP